MVIYGGNISRAGRMYHASKPIICFRNREPLKILNDFTLILKEFEWPLGQFGNVQNHQISPVPQRNNCFLEARTLYVLPTLVSLSCFFAKKDLGEASFAWFNSDVDVHMHYAWGLKSAAEVGQFFFICYVKWKYSVLEEFTWDSIV